MTMNFQLIYRISLVITLITFIGVFNVAQAKVECPIGQKSMGDVCACDSGYSCGPSLCCKENQYCVNNGGKYECKENKICPTALVPKGDVCACKSGYPCGSNSCCPSNKYCLKEEKGYKCVAGCGKDGPCRPPSYCWESQHCSYPSGFQVFIYPKKAEPADAPVPYCEVIDLANFKWGGGYNSCSYSASYVCSANSTNKKVCGQNPMPYRGISLPPKCWIKKPIEIVIRCSVDSPNGKKSVCVQTSKKMPLVNNIARLNYPKDFGKCPMMPLK